MPEGISAWLQYAVFIAGLLSSIFTILSSGVVLFLFFFKKEKIISAFKVIQNYSLQITFAELRGKLHNLSYYHIGSSPEQREAVTNILSEILGQLKGNPHLRQPCAGLIKKLESLINNPEKLTEPTKRILGHELGEVIRNLNLDTFRHYTQPKE